MEPSQQTFAGDKRGGGGQIVAHQDPHKHPTKTLFGIIYKITSIKKVT